MSDESRRIGELERMLAQAQLATRQLQASRRAARRNTAVLGACAVIFCTWTAYAGPSTMAAVAVKPDPIAQLNQKMADMEKRLQHNIDLLQLRVKRLEDKPDNVDNPDENKGGGKSGDEKTAQNGGGNGPPGQTAGQPTSSASQLLFNLVQRVTALEHRNVVRAPFLVNDSQGHALFIVTEHGGADGVRGVRVFDNSGRPEVELDAGFAEGGVIKALSTSNEKNMSMMFIGPHGPALSLGEEGHGGFYAASTDDGSGYLQVRDENGDDATLGAYTGTKTMALRFQKSDKQIAAIGISGDGTGAVNLKDAAGEVAATMGSIGNGGTVGVYVGGKPVAGLTSNEGKGEAVVYNQSGKPVAFLTESSKGSGGNITLADPAGVGIVSAGYDPSDDGDICLDRKHHLICVGVNLPLSISH